MPSRVSLREGSGLLQVFLRRRRLLFRRVSTRQSTTTYIHFL